MLQAEFEILGVDPDKVTAKAPQKSENAVFDLMAVLDDPDGEGGDPPVGITLSWTERLIGDYNQDGMVTSNDLTPIGQHWDARIDFDPPEQHGGIEYWPAGDPDDSGDGALNWRLARISGNDNVLIESADITTIAQHWEERLTGYRIWRKAPGGSFELVANPDDAGSDVTMARPSSISSTAPVRYSFTDTEATASGLGEGAYAYYVQPWDGSTSTGGPVSAVVVIDNTGMVTPEQPVAQLTVSPDFAGAPSIISLDASGSTDNDGTVEVWHWDFDADGVIDWVSTDTVPEESSNSSVIDIEPIGSGIVRATYRQGSADWLHPNVIVVDNDELASLPAYSTLGVSGWVFSPVSSNDGLESINFSITAIDHDPYTSEVVVAGYIESNNHIHETWMNSATPGIYFARQIAEDTWVQELVCDRTTPVLTEYFDARIDTTATVIHIFWGLDGEPGLVLYGNAGGGAFDSPLFICHRNSDSSWSTSELYLGEKPPLTSPRGVSRYSVYSMAPNSFAILVGDIVGTASPGSIIHHYVVWYNSGDVTIDDTGAQYYNMIIDDGNKTLHDISIDSNGRAVCLLDKSSASFPNELWILERQGPDNWIEKRLDHGNLVPDTGKFELNECTFDGSDNLLIDVLLMDGEYPNALFEGRVYCFDGSSVDILYTINSPSIGLQNAMFRVNDENSLAYFSINAGVTMHTRVRAGQVLYEQLWPYDEDHGTGVITSYSTLSELTSLATLTCWDHSDDLMTYVYQSVATRVDPRH